MNIQLRDLNGKAMGFLIISILWYANVIQQRFAEIPGFFLVLGALLVMTVIFDKSERPKTPTPYIQISIYILGTFVLGFVNAPNITAHLSLGMTIIEFDITMYCIIYFCVTRKNISFLIWNYVVMYLFISVLFIRSPAVFSESNSTIRYSFSDKMNPNALSMGLSIGCWAVLYLVMKRQIHILPAMLICSLFLYGSFLTGSRKGTLGFVICVVLWLLLCYFPLSKENGVNNSFLKFLLIFVIGFVLAQVLVPYFFQSSAYSRFLNFNDQGNTVRLDLYHTGIRYILANPLFGYGFNGFSSMCGVMSHSTLIEIPVSGGILLALIYFSSYISIFSYLFKIDNRCRSLINNYSFLFPVRMMIVLLVLLSFYSISVVHTNLLSSYYSFAIIISLSENIQQSIVQNGGVLDKPDPTVSKWRYIR